MESYEDDRMVSQIETSLASSMSDDFYRSKDIYQSKDTYPSDDMYISNDVYKAPYIVEAEHMSRAEYIRKARESCLRQLDLDPKQAKV